MGFSRKEYWSGLPFPPPKDLPDPRIKPSSLVSPVLAGGDTPLVPPGKPVFPLDIFINKSVYPSNVTSAQNLYYRH